MSDVAANDALARACAHAALEAGRAIRTAVQAMAPAERGRSVPSRLKARNVAVDARAEEIGLDRLRALARDTGLRFRLLLDDRGAFEEIGESARAEAVWVCFDAIDGTKKVAGIAAARGDRVALANDGAWAATFAFTAPTQQPFEDLRLGDFVGAAVVDGNPTVYRTYPTEVVALPKGGEVRAFDCEGASQRPVFTTTCETLSHCWLFLDSFQAFDRDSRAEGDEELAVELYRRFIDRHSASGAHDVLRQFGSLSALCRTMLGWREAPVWIESQGGAFVVVNENLPNLIPSVPIVRGAGGVSVDFDGRPLLDRRLAEGRTSVIHAANPALRDTCLAAVRAARIGTASPA